MTKLVLTCSRYRLPGEDGKPGRLVFEGDEFETTPENAERLLKADAAKKPSAADDGETKDDGESQGNRKPAPRSGAK